MSETGDWLNKLREEMVRGLTTTPTDERKLIYLAISQQEQLDTAETDVGNANDVLHETCAKNTELRRRVAELEGALADWNVRCGHSRCGCLASNALCLLAAECAAKREAK